MSKGTVNKVLLIGNLGADPETRYMPSGGAVTNLRVATTEVWKDQQGQFQERTEWHRVVLFGRQAETAKEYLRKGSKVFIEGSLRTQKWQDKNTGQDRYTTEVVANEMQMLDRSGGQAPGESAGPRERSGGSAPPPSGPAQRGPEPGFGGGGGGMEDFDDDIPF